VTEVGVDGWAWSTHAYKMMAFLFEQRDDSSPLNFIQYAVLSHNIEIVM